MNTKVELMYMASESVWAVFYLGKCRYAWPREGMTSREVAEKIQKSWQLEIDNA